VFKKEEVVWESGDRIIGPSGHSEKQELTPGSGNQNLTTDDTDHTDLHGSRKENPSNPCSSVVRFCDSGDSGGYGDYARFPSGFALLAGA